MLILKTESRYKKNLQLNPVPVYTKFWTVSMKSLSFNFPSPISRQMIFFIYQSSLCNYFDE